LLATLNLAEARNKRISDGDDLHRDRRPQLYGLSSAVLWSAAMQNAQHAAVAEVHKPE
jgi:hypothetical protein